MRNLIDKALDFIFPPICGICGKMAENYICNKCKEKVDFISKSVYEQSNNSEYRADFWIFKYDDIRDLMLKYKFKECSYLHMTFAEIILNDSKAKEILEQADYIIPVPIHKKRRGERGYNQCELIAKRLSDKINRLKCLSNVLAKKKNAVPQSILSKEDRLNNIRDAFYIKKQINLTNKTVILFDDIYTTGSTIKECIKVLKKLNYKKVYVFTIARN